MGDILLTLADRIRQVGETAETALTNFNIALGVQPSPVRVLPLRRPVVAREDADMFLSQLNVQRGLMATCRSIRLAQSGEGDVTPPELEGPTKVLPDMPHDRRWVAMCA